MSVRVLAMIARCAAIRDHGAFRVAVALASFADDAGRAFPSVRTLATAIGIDPRNVQRALARLRADGWIAAEGNARGGRPGATTVYRIAVDRLRRVATGDESATPGRAANLSETDGEIATPRAAQTPSESVNESVNEAVNFNTARARVDSQPDHGGNVR